LEELKTTAAFYKNLGSYPHSAWHQNLISA
jgi:hypothetical protein